MRRADYGNKGTKWGLSKPQHEYEREVAEQLRVAGVAWKRMEAWLRARHKVPAPPGMGDTGTTVWFVDAVPRRLHQMIRAVEWLAGPAREESDEADTALQGDGA
jgi:hypothetical protein